MTKQFSFEEAYDRLEKILEKLNSGSVALEESLKLYEEADKLIKMCSSKLSDAEKKIELLTKNREGGLQTEPFIPEKQTLFSEE